MRRIDRHAQSAPGSGAARPATRATSAGRRRRGGRYASLPTGSTSVDRGAARRPRRAGRARDGRRARARRPARRRRRAAPRAGQEVHRRRADEACDEAVRGLAPDLVAASPTCSRPPSRSTAIRSPSDERLDLVVRDVHHRRADARVQRLQLGAHLRRAARRPGWRAARRAGRRPARARARGRARPAGARRPRARAAAGRAASSQPTSAAAAATRCARLAPRDVAHASARSRCSRSTVRCGKSA